MRFTYFRFENFKGIESQKIVLNKSKSNVFALIGLNESGKTTVLEAINYFAFKSENLDALNLDNYQVSDIHNLVPINKRDNFNEEILIEAEVELDDDDVSECMKAFKAKNIVIDFFSRKIKYRQHYPFENSEYQKEKYSSIWEYDIKGKTADNSVSVKLKNDDALIANNVIKKRMPSILYFPNFLFEFPEKIYLDPAISDSKHKYYQDIIQDVLDSLNNDTNIADHLIARINSDDPKDRRNLNSVVGKMQKKLTSVIFDKWNQILNKKISDTEIILYTGKDDKGAFIEFNIKDDVDTYRIVERSLGFRWFFVYILLTQFRAYRKKKNDVFFLFDEPASNLHPSAQMELLTSFEKLNNVIYTTHSHYLINPQWLENTFVIKNDAINYDDEVKSDSKNTNIKISTYRNFAVNHPNQVTYFQPILDVLDYRPSNLELVPKVVITEGKNDFYTFSFLQKILKTKKPIKVIPGTTSSNMESLISLYLGWASDFVVLLDSDKEGVKQKKRYIDLFGDSILEKIITYADIDPAWKNTETEDLFEANDKIIIQIQCYPSEHSYNKNTFNRSVQELQIGKKTISLSKSTLDNFNKVISHLQTLLL